MGRREAATGINVVTQGILSQQQRRQAFEDKVNEAMLGQFFKSSFESPERMLDLEKKQLEIAQLKQNTGAGDVGLTPVIPDNQNPPLSLPSPRLNLPTSSLPTSLLSTQTPIPATSPISSTGRSVITPQRKPMAVQQQEFLDKLSPQDAEIVKGLADYTLDPTKTSSLFRSNARQRMIALTKMYDPSFDMKTYPQKQSFLNDFVRGTTQQNIVSLNTLSNHLGTLQSDIEQLKNTSQPAANALINFAKDWTGDTTITNFRTAKEAVSAEATRTFSGVGATQQGIQRALDNLPERASYAQMQGFLRTMAQLMRGRGQAWENRYRAVIGKEPGDLVYNQETRNTLDRILQGSTTANGSATSDFQSTPKGNKFRIIQ